MTSNTARKSTVKGKVRLIVCKIFTLHQLMTLKSNIRHTPE